MASVADGAGLAAHLIVELAAARDTLACRVHVTV